MKKFFFYLFLMIWNPSTYAQGVDIARETYESPITVGTTGASLGWIVSATGALPTGGTDFATSIPTGTNRVLSFTGDILVSV